MSKRITRRYLDGDKRSRAVFSRCGLYRYALTREWGQGGRVVFVMLNPSTADHRRNDPTIARCESRARALGATAYRIVNLFAWRATYPRDLRQAADPVGDGNDTTILRAAGWGDLEICAWGAHGSLLGRGEAVRALLTCHGHVLHHLGLTQSGHPRHPLYLPATQKPELWN